MSASSYDEALHRLLAHEGGYTNDAADPGGPTNFGITIVDYRKYVNGNATADDVRATTLDQARAIYRSKYWDALRGDELPAGIDYALFDYGVNSGIARAAKVLQRILGIADDGIIGPVTLAAMAGRAAVPVVNALCDERLAFLQSLRTWPVFGKGWGRRVAEVKDAALAMAEKAETQGRDP
jgi:lysozyme family protein